MLYNNYIMEKFRDFINKKRNSNFSTEESQELLKKTLAHFRIKCSQAGCSNMPEDDISFIAWLGCNPAFLCAFGQTTVEKLPDNITETAAQLRNCQLAINRN